MPPTAKKRPGALAIALVVAAATVLALGAAELVLRFLVPPQRVLGDLSYELPDGSPITLVEGIRRGLIVPVPPPAPRPRYMFAPMDDFFVRYTDNDVLKRDWLDAKGRVAVHIDAHGLRERDEVGPAKPAGERRIVCVGDSFTFAWGIPVELGWVRLLENELRKDGVDLRTVNCGAAGTVCIDEYVCGLEHRFHVFGPDAVILTICLNDLVPSSGLSVLDPPVTTGLRVVDLVRGAFGRRALDLDPHRDWVQELLDLPRDQALAGGLATDASSPSNDKPFEAMWSQGVPQRSLRDAKAWCDARRIPFLVVIWPFLQGLGPGRWYPFQKLHDLVAADCAAAGIPLLDVLPALRGTREEELWVTPMDPHPNPRAQQLALPAIAAFVRAHTAW
jgi:hypothetical protein